MSGLPDDPRFRRPAPQLTPELRDYVLTCLRAARPSRLRTEAIDAFARSLPMAPADPLSPVDWDGMETEALRRGMTLAEMIAATGTDDEPDPFAA